MNFKNNIRSQYEPKYEKRKFICYWWFVGYDCLSLGFHVCLSAPNIEIHLPFGFIRIGWVGDDETEYDHNGWEIEH